MICDNRPIKSEPHERGFGQNTSQTSYTKSHKKMAREVIKGRKGEVKMKNIYLVSKISE